MVADLDPESTLPRLLDRVLCLRASTALSELSFSLPYSEDPTVVWLVPKVKQAATVCQSKLLQNVTNDLVGLVSFDGETHMGCLASQPVPVTSNTMERRSTTI